MQFGSTKNISDSSADVLRQGIQFRKMDVIRRNSKYCKAIVLTPSPSHVIKRYKILCSQLPTQPYTIVIITIHL